MQANHASRIFGFDLLRGGATLTVIAGHAIYILPDTTTSIAAAVNFVGVLGVEMFFVLSGFLIGRILFNLLTGEKVIAGAFKYFLARRWFRTLPNYYALLVVNIALLFILGKDLPNRLWSYFVFLQNFSSGMGGFYGESWSLTVEEFVYLIGPLLLFLGAAYFPNRDRRKTFLWIVLGIIISAIVTKFIYYAQLTDLSGAQWNGTLRTVVIYRYDSIFYGMLASYIALRFPSMWVKYAKTAAIIGGLIAVAILLALVIFKWTPTTAPFFWNVACLPLISIAFCFIMPWCSQLKSAPAYLLKPLTYISMRSYSMYLLHYGVILKTMLYLWPTNDMTTGMLVGYALMYLMLVFVVTHFWYRWFEKPTTDLRDLPSVKNRFIS